MAKQATVAAAQPAGEYEVGYGKPPTHTRFKPGQSGNLQGRPKGAKNKAPSWGQAGFDALVREEAYRPMTINDNGRPVTMPVVQAVLRRINIDAMQGRARAQKLVGDIVSGAERRRNAQNERYQEAMITYKNEGSKHLDYCRGLGTPPPEMIPHPDDIIINMSTGEPQLIGPMTLEDKLAWQILAERRDLARNLLIKSGTELDTSEDPRRRKILREEIRLVSAKLQETVDQIGEWPNHRLSGKQDAAFRLDAIFGERAPAHARRTAPGCRPARTPDKRREKRSRAPSRESTMAIARRRPGEPVAG